MKASSPWVIACAIAIFAYGALAQDYGKIIYAFSIRDGETLALRRVTTTSANCTPMFTKFEGVDALEAAPELSFHGEEAPIMTSVSGRDCEKPVPGVIIYVTAKGVTEKKESEITLRVRMQTTNGPWQNTIRSRMLMYPVPAEDSSATPKDGKQL